jgi:transposase
VLKAQINKTDRNDARGIAQMTRVGVFRAVHVTTLRSQKLRMLLTHRKRLQSKAIAIENDLRGTLRNFGLKVGMVGMVRFEARIQELVETGERFGCWPSNGTPRSMLWPSRHSMISEEVWKKAVGRKSALGLIAQSEA